MTSELPPTPAPRMQAREALRLRAWALDVLGGRAAPPPSASPAAWRLFLGVERCALPLSSRLAAVGVALPGAEGEVLRARATEELKRSLSARAQLRLAAAAARERGIAVVVLKGGATLEGGEPVDVADLDVLAAPEDASALAAALEARGLSAAGRDAPEEERRGHELAARVAEGAVHVEVHYDVFELPDVEGARRRAVPLSGAPGLLRLAPADHLLHLLLHAVVHHPFRRGSLRDLLLVAAALRDCGEDDRAAVRRRLDAHLGADPLGAMLDMAAALAEARPPADAFPRIAAANYLLNAQFGRLGPESVAGHTLSEATFFVLGGRTERRRVWAELRDPPGEPSRLGAMRRLEARAPRLATALRGALRAGRLLAAAPVALTLAARAGRLARQAASPSGE